MPLIGLSVIPAQAGIQSNVQGLWFTPGFPLPRE